MRNLILYILLHLTVVHAGLFDVSIETVDQEPSKSLFQSAAAQLFRQLTANQNHIDQLSEKKIMTLIDSYYFLKTRSGTFKYVVGFNKDKTLALLKEQGLEFMQESSRPIILFLPSESTHPDIIEKLTTTAEKLGFQIITALMDTQDIQAWRSLTHEQNNSSIDALSERYQTSQILAYNDDESFLWFNQHVISQLNQPPEEVIAQMAHTLKKQQMQPSQENKIIVEIHGIKNITEQHNMLRVIKDRVNAKSIQITIIKPTYVILSIVYAGGIDSFITELGEPEILTTAITQNTNTDLAYEWHPKTKTA